MSRKMVGEYLHEKSLCPLHKYFFKEAQTKTRLDLNFLSSFFNKHNQESVTHILDFTCNQLTQKLFKESFVTVWAFEFKRLPFKNIFKGLDYGKESFLFRRLKV